MLYPRLLPCIISRTPFRIKQISPLWRLLENQAHHERAYANMFEQQYGPPPPPAPYPTPTPTPAPKPVFPPPIPAPVTDMAIAVQTRDAALIAQMQMMMQQMMSQNTGGGGRNYQGGRGRSGGRE